MNLEDWSDVIVCPHCGFEHDESDLDYEVCEEGEHIYDCGVCEKEMNIKTIIEISYSVTKS